MALKEFKITIVTKCCGTPFDARQLYVRNAKGHKNYANKLFGRGHVRPTSLAMHNSAGSKKIPLYKHQKGRLFITKLDTSDNLRNNHKM